MTDRKVVLASITADELRALLTENIELHYVAAEHVLQPLLSQDAETFTAWRDVTTAHTKRWKDNAMRGVL